MRRTTPPTPPQPKRHDVRPTPERQRLTSGAVVATAGISRPQTGARRPLGGTLPPSTPPQNPKRVDARPTPTRRLTEAQRLAAYRAGHNEEQRQERLRRDRERQAAKRAKEKEEQRQQRLDSQRVRQATTRANENEVHHQQRIDSQSARQANLRS